MSRPGQFQSRGEHRSRQHRTKEQQRDDHLRSPDFFDAANHPALTFQSTRVEKASEDEYKVTGNLTIRGVTKEVALTVEYLGRSKDPWAGCGWAFRRKPRSTEAIRPQVQYAAGRRRRGGGRSDRNRAGD